MPMNPAAPPPPKSEQVRTAIKQVTHDHGNAIEVAVVGVTLAVVAVLVGVPIGYAVLAAATFCAGAFIEALLEAK